MAVQLSDPNVFSPADSFKTLGSVVNVIVANAFVLAGLISFVLLIFGGFSVIVAGGDSKKLETGKNAIMGAVIGLIVVVGSFWIVQIVETITGVKILKPGI